jgi:uridine phosphorylase
MFGDVKFICMGGTPKRMLQFALYISKIINYKVPTGLLFENITASTDRYTMYKIGPVLSVNHGIGCPSMSILMNELMKLVLYAGCKDITFFRMGTCGGIGSKPGTLVITEEAVDGLFRPEFRQVVLGKEIVRQTQLDQKLVKELLNIGHKLKESGDPTIEEVVSGRTLCAHDFYEDQGRIDGIFCDHDIDDKMNYLIKCKENSVKNIEMESAVFAAYTNYAKCKSAIICVTLVDRLNGDQLTIGHDLNLQYQERPFKLVGEYIKNNL